jgi:hypothetical protein
VTRRVAVLFSGVSLIAACCTLVACDGATTVVTAAIKVPAATGTWGGAAIVPGLFSRPPQTFTASVSSVSCTAAGDCSAGGYYGYNPQSAAFVVDETGGRWAKARVVTGTAGYAQAIVSSVSCASPGNCSAGGLVATLARRPIPPNSPPYTSQAYVVNEKDGAWGTAEIVPGTRALNVGDNAGVGSLSCTAVGDCTASGNYESSPRGAEENSEAFVVDERNGVCGTAHSVPCVSGMADADTSVTSMSCASPGNCAAGGAYAGRSATLAQQAFIVNETHGIWGKAEEVPGTAPGAAKYDSEVSSVSCTSPGNCSAGGYDDGTDAWFRQQQTGRAFVVDETGGTWGTAREVSGLTALNTNRYDTQVASVSCVSATDCVAGGSFGYPGVVWPNTNAFVVGKSVRKPTAKR